MSESDVAGAFDYVSWCAALDRLLGCLPEEPAETVSLPLSQLKRLRDRIATAEGKLSALRVQLDSIRMPATVLDPSDPQVIGRLIADTLLTQSRHPLASVPRFYGSGVYALYYKGDFEAYAPIRNTNTPVYVGKADPASQHAITVVEQGDKLASRLAEHAKSIRAAENLRIEDFECRYLVVKSAWQGTAEAHLIHRFQPVWNSETKVCYGFGKHGDAAKTRSNQRSLWDTLHPGRRWATHEGNLPNELGNREILARIREHYLRHPPEKP